MLCVFFCSTVIEKCNSSGKVIVIVIVWEVIRIVIGFLNVSSNSSSNSNRLVECMT